MSPRNDQEIPTLDETQLAALYGDFAGEDRKLAEEGMADYLSGLQYEDKDEQPITTSEK